uniref:Myelin basic protein n=1 Tax=Ailuropoda melanoleuca TaxID=9646 RepID=G1MLJ2_AILME
MGNNSSHKRTKVPKQAHNERPPDMDKAGRIQQFFSHLKRKKPTEVAAGPGARPGRPGEDATGAPVGSPVAAPMLRGAGDGADLREGAREREMKMILVLLLLDARLQEEGRCAAGPMWRRAGSGCTRADPAEEQPLKRRHCPRPRP